MSSLNRDLSGGTGVWTSPTVDISTFTNLNLALNLTEVGDQEASDSIQVITLLMGDQASPSSPLCQTTLPPIP